MDEPDKIYRVITENLPRRTGLYPQVIRVLYHRNQYPLPKERKFTDTQICIHFSESVPSMEIRTGGKKYTAQCPRIYIKRAGETHQTDSSEKNILFSLAIVYNAKENIERFIPENLVFFPMELTPRIHALIDSTVELLPHVEEYGVCDRLDGLCFSILHEILLETQGASQKITQHEKQIRRAVSWLHFHMLAPVDWSELARQFGFSERSFKRHWKTYMKESPHQYLISLRMEEAKRLLIETGLNVGEIAGKVGYSSLESFGFAFRKHFGIAPHIFRCKLR